MKGWLFFFFVPCDKNNNNIVLVDLDYLLFHLFFIEEKIVTTAIFAGVHFFYCSLRQK